MLRLQMGSPELVLMKPLFYARPRLRIMAIDTSNFGSDFLMYETLEVQELDDMALLQFRRSDTFQLFTICIAEMPAIFPAQSRNCYGIHQFPVAIDDSVLSPLGKEEDHWDK
jgi:hypothetical protein